MGWWPASRLKWGHGAETPALIRNPNFGRLWGSQVLSQIAQNLLNFALIIRVFELAQHTRLANVSVALLILSFGVPSIFFAAAAGVYVDHWNRKWVLVIANAIRAILVLAYLLVEQNLALVLLLSFAISSVTQFFAPAESAAIPALVRERDMLRANSLFIFTLYASFIVGYSSSAPVIGLMGAQGPYYLTSIMFLLATLLVIPLPSLHPKRRSQISFRDTVRVTGREIVRNWNIIRRDHKLAFPITQLVITQGSLGVVLALAPALSLAILRSPLQNTSFILIIPAGLGMVVGVAFVGSLVKRLPKRRLAELGLLVAATSLLLFGLTGQLHRVWHGHELATDRELDALVAILVFVLGFMNAVIAATAQTLLQESTTDENRGKVFGALNMLINVAATLPIFFAGILADVTTPTKVIMALGFALFVFAIWQQRWGFRFEDTKSGKVKAHR